MALWRAKDKPPVELVVANLEKCYGIFHCKGDEAVLEKNAYPVGQQDRRWS